MSLKLPSVQHAVIVQRHADQAMILTVSTKAGEFELEFSHEVWKGLWDTSRWFQDQKKDNPGA